MIISRNYPTQTTFMRAKWKLMYKHSLMSSYSIPTRTSRMLIVFSFTQQLMPPSNVNVRDTTSCWMRRWMVMKFKMEIDLMLRILPGKWAAKKKIPSFFLYNKNFAPLKRSTPNLNFDVHDFLCFIYFYYFSHQIIFTSPSVIIKPPTHHKHHSVDHQRIRRRGSRKKKQV